MGPVPEESLPKDAKPGCALTGSLKLAHTSPLAGDKHAPCACPLFFTVPPPAKKDAEDSEKEDVPEEKDPIAKMRKAQKEAQVITLPCLSYRHRVAVLIEQFMFVRCRTEKGQRDCSRTLLRCAVFQVSALLSGFSFVRELTRFPFLLPIDT